MLPDFVILIMDGIKAGPESAYPDAGWKTVMPPGPDKSDHEYPNDCKTRLSGLKCSTER
jgi:hypothetical protein